MDRPRDATAFWIIHIDTSSKVLASKVTRLSVPALVLMALALLTMVSSARAQILEGSWGGNGNEEDRLATEVDDPTAILTQLKLQDFIRLETFKPRLRITRFKSGLLYR